MPPTDNSIVGGIGQGEPSQVSWLGQLMDQFAFDWEAVNAPQHAVKRVSQAMAEVLGLISQVARVRVNVMIYGKRGTEKKSVAKTIHNRSTRGDKPFFDINCRGLADHLLEAELFGHERGIFADAKNLKRGLLELSDGGTVFLDEVGDMPLTVQHKFIRVLESRTFRRIGGTQDISVDFRGEGDVACAGLSRRFPVGDPCWGIGTESPTGSGASHPGAGTESCVQSGDGLGEA